MYLGMHSNITLSQNSILDLLSGTDRPASDGLFDRQIVSFPPDPFFSSDPSERLIPVNGFGYKPRINIPMLMNDGSIPDLEKCKKGSGGQCQAKES